MYGKEVGAPIEVRFRAASGWRLVELIGTPVPWLKSDALLFTLRDLTERRRFELAHNQDARFHSMVQNSEQPDHAGLPARRRSSRRRRR